MPGTAKESMVANSSAARPAKRWRTSSQAASRPSSAVSGAAMAASVTVVQNEFHAAPDQISPSAVRSMAKALA